MSVIVHPNWRKFLSDALEHVYFEDKDTLYEIQVPRGFECKMRKIPIARAKVLLDMWPQMGVDDYDKFNNAWDLALSEPIPMIKY